MFTSKEIRQEHRLSTKKAHTNDSRRGSRQCIPLTLMSESIRSFRSGNTPDQKQIIDEIRSGNFIRRRVA